MRHQGEVLGALTVTKRAGESLTPIEDKLLDDLAHQAGLVLKNGGLTAELLQRLEELRASRQRLVEAQDKEHRRLERNLHDGAQRNLVALKVKLATRKTPRRPSTSVSWKRCRTFRNMPPQPQVTVRLRTENGELRFEVEDDGARFHAASARKGSGLTNMEDRLDALGGGLVVDSAPGQGTQLRGHVPLLIGATS